MERCGSQDSAGPGGQYPRWMRIPRQVETSFRPFGRSDGDSRTCSGIFKTKSGFDL